MSDIPEDDPITYPYQPQYSPQPAPRTTRDDPRTGAPRTTRDDPSPPQISYRHPRRTTRDDPSPPHQRPPRTTRDDPHTGAPRTTRDDPHSDMGGPGPGDRSRVNLPAAVEAEFILVSELGSGGEADLMLARSRSSGELVVVRRYRQSTMTLDRNLLATLAQADRRHLIGILDWGQDASATWEILEYAPHGSLADVYRTDPIPWHPSRVEQVLTQVTEALEYLHAMDMVHRDVKPQNILVRSVRPLDVVLTDFGLARTLAATMEMRTSSRTSAYAAPEAAAGSTSRALDWWSLGIVVVELLTGRNPFQRPDGSWFHDLQILNELLSRDINLENITDGRWNLLCQGLLTRDPNHWWTGTQVAGWQAGGRPPVVARTAAAPPAGSAGPPGVVRSASGHRAGRPFVFDRVQYDDPVALAAAMRTQWSDAARLLGGQSMNAPQFAELRDWLQDKGLDDAVRILTRSSRPERLLAQLLFAIDPDSPPVFRGYTLAGPGLTGLLTAAGGRSHESAALEGIYNEGILSVYDGLPGCDGYALTDSRWRALFEAFTGYLPPQANAEITPEQRGVTAARMLAVAINPALATALATALASDAAAARADQAALAQPWFRQLVSYRPGPDLAPAHDAAVALARDIAATQTHRQQAE